MSWRKVKLGDFLKVRKDRYKPNDKAIAGLKRIEKIDFSGNIYLSEKPSKTDMILVKKGDLVISGINVEKGAMSVYQGDEDVTATIHYSSYEFDNNKIDIDFLKYFLKSAEFKEALKEQVPGGIKTEIKPKHLLPLEVEIPINITDQRILVDNLNFQFGQIDSLSSEQSHQLNLIKKLRQQILKEAMQGKLVPQNPKDEHASKLLEKIKAKKAKSGKKEKSLPEIKPEEIPFDIPENWVWCRLGEISYIASGSTPKQDTFVSEGIPYLKMYNLKNQQIDFDYRPQYIKPEVHNGQLKRSRTEIGDVIMNIVGPPLGKLAIIPKSLPQANFNQAAVLIRPYLFKEINKWIFWYLNEMSEINSIVTKGVAGQDNISVSQSNSIKIPIPPIAEQKRIVSKIEELMNLCDELEAGVKTNQEFTNLLYQTALKEALQPQVIEEKQEDLAIAAESQTEYEKGKIIELPRLQDKEDNHFVKRKVLATYIINQSLDDQKFGDVKFEKLLHLSDYFVIKRNLGQNYYQQAAGPYDNAFTHQYFQQVLNSKWFNRSKKGNQFVFSTGQNHSKSTNIYGYFSDNELSRVNEIISYFKNYDYEQPEIVSTLYAVWNNRIILQQDISDDLVIEGFYNWDEQKKKYERNRLEKALQWMRDKNFVPDGWGKVIEKPKTKKKK